LVIGKEILVIGKRIKKLSRNLTYRYLNLVQADFVSLNDVKLNLRNTGLSSKARKSFYRGSFESPETRIISATLNPSDVVLEIGAGIGYISILCAKMIGGENVYCYEANPSLIPIIEENCRLNNVKLNISNTILSKKDGYRDFFVMPEYFSSSMIKRSDCAEPVSVKTININNELNTISPTYLIIDIEGGEKELVYLIDYNGVKKICIEVHPNVIGHREVNNIIAALQSNGFMYDVDLSEKRILYFFRH